MTDAQARVTAAGSSPDVRQTLPFRASNTPFCDKNATLKSVGITLKQKQAGVLL